MIMSVLLAGVPRKLADNDIGGAMSLWGVGPSRTDRVMSLFHQNSSSRAGPHLGAPFGSHNKRDTAIYLYLYIYIYYVYVYIYMIHIRPDTI